MNKTVVVYASRYGATREYAQWIAQALSCDLIENKGLKIERLNEYDTIVYGGGLYAGGVNGIGLLKKNADALKGKKIVLFTCGISDPADPENVSHIKDEQKKRLPEALFNQTTIFCLRGGMDYKRLSLLHRMMMGMLKCIIASKPPEQMTDSDRGILATYGKNVDFCDKASIQPLLACVREAT